jgi:hypothetical protein
MPTEKNFTISAVGRKCGGLVIFPKASIYIFAALCPKV